MPEKVSIREDMEIIVVESFGVVSADDLTHSLKEVVKYHTQTGYKKVFVDATKEEKLPETFPVYEFGTEMAESMKKLKLAVTTSPNTDRDIKFLVTVAVNRGLNIKVFDTSDEALKWLTGKSGKTYEKE